MRNSAFLSVKNDTAYVETSIAVPGFELHYVKNASGKFEGGLNISIAYLKDTSVFALDQYLLRTPEIDDTVNISFNILDLRRERLPDGEYNVRLKINDANNVTSKVEVTQDLEVLFNRKNISLSDIEFVQDYTPTVAHNLYSKNGYDIRPLAISYFPDVLPKLTFYAEIYNTAAVIGDDDFLMMYSVKDAKTGNVVNELSRFTRQKASAKNILFSEFDIADLPTGNYFLEVQVKNKKNETLGQQTAFFQRFNKSSVYQLSNISLIDVSNKFVKDMASDSMNYYLSCLMPRAEMFERDYIIRIREKKDTLLMKQFFYNFWQRRNKTDPQIEWSAYNKMVQIVNYNYSTQVLHGFETDRGRVYLQYGAPNSINGSDHDSNAYPYEIWQYYKLNQNQSNVKFVFCNSDLVSNDYKLIHSEAHGELYDSRWRFKVFKTFKETNGYSNLDQEKYPDSYGSQVDELYNH